MQKSLLVSSVCQGFRNAGKQDHTLRAWDREAFVFFVFAVMIYFVERKLSFNWSLSQYPIKVMFGQLF